MKYYSKSGKEGRENIYIRLVRTVCLRIVVQRKFINDNKLHNPICGRNNNAGCVALIFSITTTHLIK